MITKKIVDFLGEKKLRKSFMNVCSYLFHFAGQVGSGARSYYHGQPPDPKMGLESQSNKEAGGTQPHDQDMELGFEDKSLPMSFEGLERKFFDEVTKLAKEQGDAEVAENARHREVRLL